MKLSDFTTKKLKNETKHWGILTAGFVTVGAASIALAFTVPALSFLFIVGLLTAPVGLIYTLPNYIEKIKDLKNHTKWLVANQNNLTSADNCFEVKDEKGNIVPAPEELKRELQIKLGERKDYLKAIKSKIVEADKSSLVAPVQNDITK